MLRYLSSPLFSSPARVLVNTVNTVGVMGKGVALDFKKRYPPMFKAYKDFCDSGRFKVGQLWLYRTPNRWVLNFPTKESWRRPSKPEYVEAGLDKFVHTYAERGIDSISFPLLGCGNGGLDFDTQVRPLMESYLGKLPIPVFIHLRREGTSFVPEHEWPDLFESAPTPGTFGELWEDLRQLSDRNLDLRTFTTETPYQLVEVTGDNLIFDRRSGSRVHIPVEDVDLLWSRMEAAGTVRSSEAPGRIGREYSLVFPLLAELPYIGRVELAEDYGEFHQRPSQGLQLRFRRPADASSEFEVIAAGE